MNLLLVTPVWCIGRRFQLRCVPLAFRQASQDRLVLRVPTMLSFVYAGQ